MLSFLRVERAKESPTEHKSCTTPHPPYSAHRFKVDEYYKLYNPLHEFHPKIPIDWADVISTCDAPLQVLQQLPAELWGTIFVLLSTEDLAVATWVCKSWRKWILENEWLLSRVLGNSPRTRQNSERSEFQPLQQDRRELMRRGPSSSQGVRFLNRELSFACASGSESIVAANFGIGNTPFGYLITQRMTSVHVPRSKRLHVYHLGWSGRPLFVGSARFPDDMSLPVDCRCTGSSSYRTLTFIDASRRWDVDLIPKSAFSRTVAPYLMTTRSLSSMRATEKPHSTVVAGASSAQERHSWVTLHCIYSVMVRFSTYDR